jgi:hypothetical protein
MKKSGGKHGGFFGDSPTMYIFAGNNDSGKAR